MTWAWRFWLGTARGSKTRLVTASAAKKCLLTSFRQFIQLHSGPRFSGLIWGLFYASIFLFWGYFMPPFLLFSPYFKVPKSLFYNSCVSGKRDAKMGFFLSFTRASLVIYRMGGSGRRRQRTWLGAQRNSSFGRETGPQSPI